MEFSFPASAFGDPQQRLLRGIPAFSKLSAASREALAEHLKQETFAAGSVVLEEGAPADRVFLIEEGEVEVSIRTDDGRVPVSRLSDGEMFGEIGLLLPGHRRTARVTALKPLAVSTLKNQRVDEIFRSYPESKSILEEAADQALIRSFVKSTRPFEALTLDRLRVLSEKLVDMEFEAGDTIVRQGEPGDTCFLVRRGTVDVVREDATGARSAARMGTGDIIGESALLTSTLRDATLVAVERASLLALRRADLIEVLDHDRRIAQHVVELLRERDRPKAKEGIILQPRPTPSGETIWVLGDPRRLGAYHQLSSLGLFVWHRLDGTRTVSEVAAEHRAARGEVLAEEVARIMAELAEAGFALAKQLDQEVAIAVGTPLPWWKRWWRRLMLRLFGRSN